MLLVKIAIYIGVCVYRRSCLIWSPVVGWREKRTATITCGLGTKKKSDQNQTRLVSTGGKGVLLCPPWIMIAMYYCSM